MSAAQAVVVGVSLAIMLAITATVILVWRNQVRRRRDVTPQDRYQHEISHLRRSGSKLGFGAAVMGIWAAGGTGSDSGGGCDAALLRSTTTR